jgi:hypothetical protein
MEENQAALDGVGSRNSFDRIRSIVEIVAPATLITALLAYIGWIRNQAYYGYFGISQGVLKPSLQDYAFRSADVSFGATARLVVCALILVGVDRAIALLRAKVPAGKVLRFTVGGIAAVGSISFMAGLLLLLGVVPATVLSPFVGAVLLGVGAVLVVRFWSPALEIKMILYVVLALGLFWAGTLYAQDLGQQAARGVDADPSRLPLVTVFSVEYMDLPGSQVVSTQTEHRGKLYYRYTGLSLITYSNNRWFLITGQYGGGYRRSVVILEDTHSVRVEVASS